MENISQMSLLEVALKIMEEKGTTVNIYDLIKEVLAAKGLEDPDNVYATQRLESIKFNEIIEYLASLKEALSINKKNDEEIVKTQERSLIQMEDINFEVIYQKNSSDELFDVVKPFFNAEYNSYEDDEN